MDRFNHIIIGITLLVSLLLSNTSWSTPNHLPYFSANYDATIKGVSIKASREFKAVNEHISELRFNATSIWAEIDEASQFFWKDGNIKPTRFKHQRSLFGAERKQTLTFDWTSNTIISTDKDKTYHISNPKQALDHLSFQLQLQHDLLHSKTDDLYRIVTKKRIKEYHFKILGEETLSTGLGMIKTLKVKVIREKKNRETYFWLAENWHYLLVRLEQYEDDKKEFTLELTQATIDGQQISVTH